MAEGDAVLIAAQSGRALAQAARRAGLRPFVLDLFGDEDTRALAEAYRPLTGRFGAGRRDGAAVLTALDDLAGRAGRAPIGLVLGSGFEAAPDLVAAMGSRHRLLGASAEVVRRLKDPIHLAALCAELAIPHPAMTREPVTDHRAWLCKRVGGSGGGHIRPAMHGPAPRGCYFQARVAGVSRSLNFVSDGSRIAALALTEQWCAPGPTRRYRYAGAVAAGCAEAREHDHPLLQEIVPAIERLAIRAGLRGLASADLLIDGQSWWLLEINPRPGATLDVLDRRATPLVGIHIAASLGPLGAIGPAPVDAAGAQICYARSGYAAVPPLTWPDFAVDRPCRGSRVARGAPLCTVTASARGTADVKVMLRERARTVVARLDEGKDDDGYRFEAAEHQRAKRAARRAPGQ